MNTGYAASHARDLMNQHGLTDWVFEWDRAKRRAGCCNYTRKRISLSYHYVIRNEWDEVRDTILHEIAHALAGKLAGHGWQWKQVCTRIGARPVRCYNSKTVDMPAARYVATCDSCSKPYHRHRRPSARRNLFCSQCYRRVPNLMPLVWRTAA